MSAADATVVPLRRGDVGAIYRLYLAALARVPNPAAVRPDEPSFFDTIFDTGGEVLGLLAAGRLAAYGVLRPELTSELDRVGLEGIAGPCERLWVLDGSAVHPDYWRHGMQRTIIEERLARIAALGARHVIAKASPGNLPSLRNLLKCGFVTVGLVRKPYGWRYVQYRPVAAPIVQPAEGIWIAAGNIEEARARFAAGEVASACHAGADHVVELQFAQMPALRSRWSP
ncbi:MAG: GNAT family N-acetyltransferase [Pseudomonadota bacterium]